MKRIRTILFVLFGILLFVHLAATSSFSYTINLTQDYVYNTVSIQGYVIKTGEIVSSVSESSSGGVSVGVNVPTGFMSIDVSQIYDPNGYIGVQFDKTEYPLGDWYPYYIGYQASIDGQYILTISDGDPGPVYVDYKKTSSFYYYASIWPEFEIPFGGSLLTDGVVEETDPFIAGVELNGSLMMEVGKPYTISFDLDAPVIFPNNYITTLEILGVRPVPEPATMFLLGSSLIGLAGLRKKFKK